jgi:Abortive infection alpha
MGHQAGLFAGRNQGRRDMDNDPTEAVTEGAKALQEVAKTGGKLIDASGRVGGWLDRIFGQGIEDTVALHWSDRIRARRIERAIYDWERLTELMRKVESRLSSKSVPTLRLVPPKIALAIIEHATVEDDDDLHSLWANLLTTGLDAAAGQVHNKYISVLADLTRDDAVVFRSLCQQWFNPEKPPKPDRYGSLTYGPTVDGAASHDAVSIITLNRLGLISPGYTDFISYAPNEDRDFKNPEPFTGSDVRTYGNLDVVEVTDFGVAFYKAVITD